MIRTYATLVMILVSGIILNYYSDMNDRARIDEVNRWSSGIIPTLSVSLYALLFLTLVR